MNINYIIIDDDLLSRELLEGYCKKIKNLTCKGIFSDAIKALSYLQTNKVDLLLLDVEMPNLTGIALLDALPILPHVIFTTSKSEYAYDAFELEAIDYLKKPFRFDRFEKAIQKIRTVSTVQYTAPPPDRKNIYIKENGKYKRILLDDILYFQNVTDYVCIKTKHGSHTIISTLKSIVNKLPSERFLKVHRSYIVNLNEILDIDESTLVVQKTVIPISRTNRPLLMKKINLI